MECFIVETECMYGLITEEILKFSSKLEMLRASYSSRQAGGLLLNLELKHKNGWKQSSLSFQLGTYLSLLLKKQKTKTICSREIIILNYVVDVLFRIVLSIAGKELPGKWTDVYYVLDEFIQGEFLTTLPVVKCKYCVAVCCSTLYTLCMFLLKCSFQLSFLVQNWFVARFWRVSWTYD